MRVDAIDSFLIITFIHLLCVHTQVLRHTGRHQDSLQGSLLYTTSVPGDSIPVLRLSGKCLHLLRCLVSLALALALSLFWFMIFRPWVLSCGGRLVLFFAILPPQPSDSWDCRHGLSNEMLERVFKNVSAFCCEIKSLVHFS